MLVYIFSWHAVHSLWSPTEGGHVIGWAMHHKLQGVFFFNGNFLGGYQWKKTPSISRRWTALSRPKKCYDLAWYECPCMTQPDSITWYGIKCAPWKERSWYWPLTSFIDYGGQALVTSQHYLGFLHFSQCVREYRKLNSMLWNNRQKMAICETWQKRCQSMVAKKWLRRAIIL